MKLKPKLPLGPKDEGALRQAYQGVEPLKRKQGRVEPAPPPSSANTADRAVRFTIRRDHPFVEGLRSGASDKLLRPLSGASFAPDAALDLHGLRSDSAKRAIEQFLREKRQAGARSVLIIAGKGQHSEGGESVLRDVLVEALTQGSAAAWVLAFASAHNRHGGSGALAILLSS